MEASEKVEKLKVQSKKVSKSVSKSFASGSLASANGRNFSATTRLASIAADDTLVSSVVQ
jgi:hypothetical protein